MDNVSDIQHAQYRSIAVVDQLSGYATGVWHPEDIVRLEGTRWVLVSAMRSVRGRGALLAVEITGQKPATEIAWRPEAESGRVSAAAFDPHGIDVRRLADGRFEVLVVDHGGGEAIDRLLVEVRDRPEIIGGERIDKPHGTSGNAVAFAPGGGFVMSSMFDPSDAGFVARFAAAEPTGFVWRWQEQAGWERLGPALSGANGIAVAPDGTIIVSEWAARRVWWLSHDGEVLAKHDVEFLPDNLRWLDADTLLLAGQTARPEQVFGCEARGERCPMGFTVAHVDLATRSVATLLRVSDDEAARLGFGGATGALQVGTETWVASFTGERIARFTLANPILRR